MANNVGWGQGSVNNDIGWGQGAVNNSVDWGNIQAISPSGETNIVGGGADERFIITVKTDNAGTSATNQFTLPTIGTGYNYDVEYDGQTLTNQTGDVTLTFPSGAGTYDIKISGSFPRCYFNAGGDKAKLLDIKNFGIYALGSTSQDRAFFGCSNLVINATDIGHFENVTNFNSAWSGCSSLTSFPLIDTSSGANLTFTWYNCSSLTSFPLIDTSSITGIAGAWRDCSSLTSFPLIDTSSGINFNSAWLNCTSLTSFPLIDTSSGTNFTFTWNNCTSLISFPLIDTSSGTIFDRTWQLCSSLTSFPANAFDTNIATNYSNAFSSTNLTTQSIDDILVSLDTSGVSNGTFAQSGGQAPSATGQTAITNLVNKGWTITTTT